MTPPAFCKISWGEACRYYRLRLTKTGEEFSEFCGIPINCGQYAFRALDKCPEREHRNGMQDMYLYSDIHMRMYDPNPQGQYTLEFLKEGKLLCWVTTEKPFWDDPEVEKQAVAKLKETFDWIAEKFGIVEDKFVLERSIQAIHNIAKVMWEKHQDDLQWEEGA